MFAFMNLGIFKEILFEQESNRIFFGSHWKLCNMDMHGVYLKFISSAAKNIADKGLRQSIKHNFENSHFMD